MAEDSDVVCEVGSVNLGVRLGWVRKTLRVQVLRCGIGADAFIFLVLNWFNRGYARVWRMGLTVWLGMVLPIRNTINLITHSDMQLNQCFWDGTTLD